MVFARERFYKKVSNLKNLGALAKRNPVKHFTDYLGNPSVFNFMLFYDIPIIFYFNGVHEDYHKHSDTPDKIEYELMAKRARLIFQTAWEVANRDERITADKL